MNATAACHTQLSATARDLSLSRKGAPPCGSFRYRLKRLGGGARGAAEIKAHPFFAAIDWRALLRRKISPGFEPKPLKNSHDTNNFDPTFTRMPVHSTDKDDAQHIASASVAQAFAGFTYEAQSNLLGRSAEDTYGSSQRSRGTYGSASPS